MSKQGIPAVTDIPNEMICRNIDACRICFSAAHSYICPQKYFPKIMTARLVKPRDVHLNNDKLFDINYKIFGLIISLHCTFIGF